MADIADVAAEQTELLEAARLAAARHAATRREVEPMGECHFCGEEFGEEQGHYVRLYCDTSCGAKHARERQIAGWSSA